MYADFSYQTPERSYVNRYAVVTPEREEELNIRERNVSYLDTIMANLDFSREDEEEDREMDIFDDWDSRMGLIGTPLYSPVIEQDKNIVHKNIVFIMSSDVQEDDECPICLTNQTNTMTSCNHKFCMSCVESHIKSCQRKTETPCPLCRCDITEIYY